MTQGAFDCSRMSWSRSGRKRQPDDGKVSKFMISLGTCRGGSGQPPGQPPGQPRDIGTTKHKKTCVLYSGPPKMLKNRWLYKQRGRKKLKSQRFYCKPSPGHRPATDPGSGWTVLAWRNDEEPLQTSCLRNKYVNLNVWWTRKI